MSAALLAGLLAGYGIALPIGPVGTYLVGLTARSSLRAGQAAGLGVATVDGLYALAGTLGGTALAGLVNPIAGPLKIVSAVVLAALALRVAIRAFRQDAQALDALAPPGPLRAYTRLVAMTLINPTTVVYFTALIVGGHAGGGTFGERSVFVLAAFAASASWHALLAGGGALLGRLLTGHSGQRITALASSAVIVFLAVRLALT